MVDKTLVSHALGHAAADAAYRIAQTQTAYADQRAEEQFRVVVDEVRACLRGRPAPEQAELLASLEAAFPLPQDQPKGERPALTAVRGPSDWKDALEQLKERADPLAPAERDAMRAQVLQWLGVDPQPRTVAATVPDGVLKNVQNIRSARDKLVKCRKDHFPNVSVPPRLQQTEPNDAFKQLADLTGDVILEVSALDAAVKKVCEMGGDDFQHLDEWFDPETIIKNQDTRDARSLWKWYTDLAQEKSPRDRIRDEIKKVMASEVKRVLQMYARSS